MSGNAHLKWNKIVIAGGTGFLGTALVRAFAPHTGALVVLTRDPHQNRFTDLNSVKLVAWNGRDATGWAQILESADAIINLAGASIAGLRWTEKKRKQILNSRVNATLALVEAVQWAQQKPTVVLQASAVGFYGKRGTEVLDETESAGTGFLSEVVQQWELAAAGFETAGVRTIFFRTGVVLGAGGGSLSLMSLPFRLFVGGHFGTGEQYLSWIHITDLVRLYQFALTHPTLVGIVNAVSPNPVRGRDFFKTLGRVLHRAKWLNIPAWTIKLVLGEMGESLLLESLRVIPRRAMEAEFTFHYPALNAALKDVLQ